MKLLFLFVWYLCVCACTRAVCVRACVMDWYIMCIYMLLIYIVFKIMYLLVYLCFHLFVCLFSLWHLFCTCWQSTRVHQCRHYAESLHCSRTQHAAAGRRIHRHSHTVQEALFLEGRRPSVVIGLQAWGHCTPPSKSACQSHHSMAIPVRRTSDRRRTCKPHRSGAPSLSRCTRPRRGRPWSWAHRSPPPSRSPTSPRICRH